MIDKKEVTKLWTSYQKAHEGKHPNCDVVIHHDKVFFYHRRCRPHE